MKDSIEPSVVTISDLARDHKVSRTTIRRWLAAGWKPENGIVLQDQSVTMDGPRTLGGILLAIGCAAGGVGLYVNVTYLLSIGWVAAVIGALFDALSLALPPSLAHFIRDRRWGWALIAGIFIPLAFSMTVMHTVGYLSMQSGVAIAGQARAALVQSILVQDLAGHPMGVEAAQAAVRSECATGEGKVCRQRRDELREAISRASAIRAQAVLRLSAEPVVAEADPMAEGIVKLIAWLRLGSVVPRDIEMVRLLSWTLLPVLAGVLMAMGWAIAARGR